MERHALKDPNLENILPLSGQVTSFKITEVVQDRPASEEY